MAINIKFDLVGNPEPPTIILATRNGNKLGQLDIDEKSIELIDKFNEASEISFTVNKYISGKITNLWDKLVDFKLVYCKEWDMWFEITVELDEATESVKTVFCTQLGQAELSQIMLYNVEINTEKDIARDDYKITILKDYENSGASLLDRLLEKAPHYSVIHIDDTLVNIQRSFSFDDISIYDAFQEVAEEIGCLFVFHSDSNEKGMPNRTISVYDLQQNCNDCGYRGEFTDICPNLECPSRDLDYQSKGITYGYGEDTLIFVTSDELASNGIQLTTDTDSVKNCFKLEAGDDLMTATIRNRNPNGTDYIWYFSDATKEDMPDELVEKIESYDELYKYYYNDHVSKLDENLVNSYNILVEKYKEYYNTDSTCVSCGYKAEFTGDCPNCGSSVVLYGNILQSMTTTIKGFSSLMQAYYNTIDLGWYLKSGLMPDINMSDTNAEEQGLLLSFSLPPLIAVSNLDVVSKATADNAVLTMAKAIVNSGYKVTISSSNLSGNDWSGIFVIENYSDEKDIYTTGTISRTLTDWDETYIKQKIDKLLSKENTDNLSITGLFEKDVLISINSDKKYEFSGEFWEELHKYALAPLTNFHNACQACLDILVEQGVGKDNSKKNPWDIDEDEVDNSLYVGLYIPYYEKLIAIEAEMKIRESEVNSIIDLQTNIEKIKVQIQSSLNFEDYLDKDLWLQFSAYRREDKYSNKNYVSDGLNNVELFERAFEFYKVAENEIFKSSELQHSISATLNNLLAIPKFKPLVESFKVGNWIRVQIDGDIYKLRLVEYEISYDDFDNISVKFSDVAKTKNGYSDLENILSDAQSMASSYDGIRRQANLGNEARNMIRQWLNEGLDASLVQIQNNTNEDIVIDNNGLIGRSYSDITEEYSPEQIRLTHNIIAFTDDNWKSVKQAIGKHKYKYYDEGKKLFVDETGFGVSADFVTAGIVSGSQIIGGNIYSDNYSITGRTGSYINLRDGTFSFAGGSLRFDGESLLISSPDVITKNQVTEINENWLKTTEVYAEKLWVNLANVNGELSASHINTNGLIAENISATDIEGKNILGGYLLIGDQTKEGTYTEITSDGSLYCNSGVFSGQIAIGEYAHEDEEGNDIVGHNFFVDEYGNVTMNGNITLGGNITWTTPFIMYQYCSTNSSDDEDWHDIQEPDDIYRRESFDGGETWGDGYQFIAQDGEDGRDGDSASLPDYIKGTYIDATEVTSCAIYGDNMYVNNAFNIAKLTQNSSKEKVTVGTVYGKMGYAEGRNVWGDTTHGVALSYGDDLVDYDSQTNYIIVTEGGIRIQANGWTETGHNDDMILVEWSSQSLTVTPNGVFVNGEPIGSGSGSGTGGTVTAVWG